MTYQIELQNLVENQTVPDHHLLQRWVSAALNNWVDSAELCVRVVNEDEIKALNATYRKKNKPTNILSFPFEAPPGVELEQRYLGDLIVCAAVMEQEAKQQHKTLEAHWAHIIVHGVLHLLGYDHEQENEAEVMEGLEIEILNTLGYANPYEVNIND